MGCLPYGPLSIAPAILSIVALFLTYVFTFDCVFFTAESKKLELEILFEKGLVDQSTPQGYGLWFVQSLTSSGYVGTQYNAVSYVSNGCTSYSAWGTEARALMDTPMIVARVFSIITAAFSACAVLSAVLPLFLEFDYKSYFVATAALSMVLGVFSIICLVALSSDLCKESEFAECSLGRSGVICVVASLLWFLSGCFMCLVANAIATKDSNGTGTTTTVTHKTAEEVARERSAG